MANTSALGGTGRHSSSSPSRFRSRWGGQGASFVRFARWAEQQLADDLRCGLVAVGNGVGVHPEGGGGVSVTETAGHGSDIRAGSDQLSGAEMTQVMKADIHSNPLGHAPEGLAQTVRFERLGAVRLDAQYVSVGREDRANLAGNLVHTFPVGYEHGQGERVEGHATVGVSLCRPNHQLTMIEPMLDSPSHPDAARLEVEIAPPQAAELTPPAASDRRQSNGGAQDVGATFLGSLYQPSYGGRARRRGRSCPKGRRAGTLRYGGCDNAPTHGLV